MSKIFPRWCYTGIGVLLAVLIIKGLMELSINVVSLMDNY
jgi:hypothetical protein